MRPDEPETEVRPNRPINVSAVVRLHVNEDATTIETWTNGGQIFGFVVRPDGFELVRARYWTPSAGANYVEEVGLRWGGEKGVEFCQCAPNRTPQQTAAAAMVPESSTSLGAAAAGELQRTAGSWELTWNTSKR